MMKRCLFVLCLMLFFVPVSAQYQEPASDYLDEISRNSIFVTGSYLLWHYSVNLNYERIFFISSTERLNTHYGYRLSYGIIDGNGHIVQGSLDFLFGRQRNFFELNTGLTFINEPFSYGDRYVSIVLNAGYRRQKPEGGLIYRIGLGAPEGLYVSIGYCF